MNSVVLSPEERIRRVMYYEGHPLVRRMRMWANNVSGVPILSTGWQTKAFQYIAIKRMLAHEFMLFLDGKQVDDTHQQVLTACAAVDTENAQVYLWRDQMVELAYGTEMPSHTISNELMAYDSMLFVHEVPRVRVVDGTELMSTFVLLSHGTSHFSITVDVSAHVEGKSEYGLMTHTIPFGAVYPESFDPDTAVVVGRVLKMMSFIASPYVDKERTPVERVAAREVRNTTKYKNDPLEAINVVTLRREVREALAAHQRETTGIRNAHKRWWWVSGHNRKQWYPSEGAHHVIWIAPYRKGDTEAAEMVEKIYKVSR